MKISGAFAFLAAAVATQSTSAFVPNESFRSKSWSSLAANQHSNHGESSFDGIKATAAAMSLSLMLLLSAPLAAHADGQTEKFKLPPIDFNDKNRCKLNSSTIGQANAARDKLYDLRQCQLSGAKAQGFDLSGVIMSKTDVSKANFQDAYFSKGYLQGEWWNEESG